MKKKKLIIMVLICSIFLYLNVFAEESLLVDENGNVGIGTETPDYDLHVAGVAKIEDGNLGTPYLLTEIRLHA